MTEDSLHTVPLMRAGGASATALWEPWMGAASPPGAVSVQPLGSVLKVPPKIKLPSFPMFIQRISMSSNSTAEQKSVLFLSNCFWIRCAQGQHPETGLDWGEGQ